MLLASPCFSSAEEAPKWQFGTYVAYLSGDYGQEDTTDLFYASFFLKRYLGWGDVTVTVPYLNVSSDGATVVDGAVEPVEGGGSGSGLGDVVLKGRYYAVEQHGWIPFIDLVASVKIPTADEDKGLGTGELDFTGMVELAYRLGDSGWTALAEAGYTFVGEPSDMEVDNRFLYGVGLAYELDPQTTVSGYLDGRTAIFRGNEDALSILLIGEYKYRPQSSLTALLEIGLTNGSPDVGITLGWRTRM
ncbi:MAG TPA: transporter [Sedimentisphaerales bacterium]|nr:transporter [Sedimentisphaerales bacterium]